MEVRQSDKLAHVAYDVRGPLLVEATRLEAEGHRILKLNIGNPAPFGFEAPEEILQTMIRNLPTAQGYSDAKGHLLGPPRGRAVLPAAAGVDGVDVDDICLGNGVCELIAMTLQALLNDGDEVLIPAPDYPLWTAATSLSRRPGRCTTCATSRRTGSPTSTTSRPRSPTAPGPSSIINPNNPTGAVYPREMLEALRRARPPARPRRALRRDLRQDPLRRRRAHRAPRRSRPTCSA